MVPVKDGSYDNDPNDDSYIPGREGHESEYNVYDDEDFPGYKDGDTDYEEFNNIGKSTGTSTQAVEIEEISDDEGVDVMQASLTEKSGRTPKSMTPNVYSESYATANGEHQTISADDIDDDYFKESLDIENPRASTALEEGVMESEYEFDEPSESEAPTKETEYTNRISRPLASKLQNAPPSSSQKTPKSIQNQHTVVATSKKPAKKAALSTSSEAVQVASKEKTTSNNGRSRQQASPSRAVRGKGKGKTTSSQRKSQAPASGSNTISQRRRRTGGSNESDDDDEFSRFGRTTTTFSASRSSNSRTVSMLENQHVDEELTIGIIHGVFSWIHMKLTAFATRITYFFTSIVEFFSMFSSGALLAIFTIVTLGIYAIWAGASGSWIPSDSLFIPSTNPPEDISELSNRLLAVESEVHKLSKQSIHLERSGDAIESQLTALQRKLYDISKGMTSFNDKISSVSQSNSRNEKKLGDIERTVKEIDRNIFNTKELVLREQELGKSRDQEINQNERRISDVSNIIQEINGKIESLKHRVKYLEDAENIEDIVARTIDKVLPAKLVVSVNSTTGDIEPTPEFWRFLLATFESTIEKSSHLEGKIKQVVRNHPELLPLRTSTDVSAEEFHEHTQRAVKSYFDDYVKNNDAIGKLGHYPESSAIVTRDVFNKMIRKELEGMRDFTIGSLASLETKIKGGMGDVRKELVDALNDHKNTIQSQLQKEHERDVLGHKDNVKEVPQQGHGNYNSNHHSSILLNGTTLTLEALIKKSIEKYISHTIAKPDFADPASGSRINHYLTSTSYDWKRQLPFLERQWRSSLNLMGFGRMKINPPITAFTNDVNLGSCWPFNGNHGNIALILGSTITPSDLGIVHISAGQSSNPKSAPRHVSLWVEVSDPELRKRISLLVDQSPGPVNDESGLLGLVSQPHSIPSTYVKIMTAEYDLFSEDEFQVFPIPVAVQRLGVKTNRVIFNIESNWGHADFTCIYRLRLFGDGVPDTEVSKTDATKTSTSTSLVTRESAVVYDAAEAGEPILDDYGEEYNNQVLEEEDEFYINAQELIPPRVNHQDSYEKGRVIVRGSLDHDTHFFSEESF